MPGSHCAFTIGTYSDSLNKHLWRKADCFNVAISIDQLRRNYRLFDEFWCILALVSCLRLCFITFPSFQFPSSFSQLSTHHSALQEAMPIHSTKNPTNLRHPKWGNSCGKMWNTNLRVPKMSGKKNKLDWNDSSQITHSITNLQRWA